MQTRFLALGPRIGMLLVAQGRLILLFLFVFFRHGSVSHTNTPWYIWRPRPAEYVMFNRATTHKRCRYTYHSENERSCSWVGECCLRYKAWFFVEVDGHSKFPEKRLKNDWILIGLYPAFPTQVPNMFRKHSNRSKIPRDAFWYTFHAVTAYHCRLLLMSVF